MIAGRIANLSNGQHAASIEAATSQDDAADMLNVGRASVQRARVSLNLKRRNLSKQQAAMAFAELANLPNHRPAVTGSIAPLTSITLDEAADRAGVSREQIKRAKSVIKNAAPEIVEAMMVIDRHRAAARARQVEAARTGGETAGRGRPKGSAPRGAQANEPLPRKPQRASAAAAAEAGTSARTVERVIAVEEKGTREPPVWTKRRSGHG